MAFSSLRHFWRILRKTRNPIVICLDKMGLRKRPYVVRTWDGFSCELRPGRGDEYEYYEILVRHDYLNQGQQLRSGDTVIDVGAGIGCFSMLAARAVGPHGRVIAVEPQSAAYDQLCANLKRNGMTHVTAIRAAVGAREGRSELHTGQVGLFGSLAQTVDGHPTGTDVEEVDVTTLSRIMETFGIDRCRYLKIDCEGGEYEMLLNLRPEVAGQIDQVTMELHEIAGHAREEIPARLQALGFRICPGGHLLYARR